MASSKTIYGGRNLMFLVATAMFCSVISGTVYLFRKPFSYGQSMVEPSPTPPSNDSGVGRAYVTIPDRLSKAFTPLDPENRKYLEWNTRALIELTTCLALENCGHNQNKVALLAAHWFEEAIVRGWRGGEGVWAVSVHKHLKAMGYTTFFANNFEEALEQYRLFPDLVNVVIRNRAGECHSDPNCVKGPTNPTGIPAWKIFDFEYFASGLGDSHDSASLLGGKWILSANPVPTEPSACQYIGFSIEDDCQTISTIPLVDRSHRVWMLMKQLTYIYDQRFAWNKTYFALASTSEPSLDRVQFVGAWEVDQTYQWNAEEQGIMEDIENKTMGVVNLRKALEQNLSPEEFLVEVSKSKVMLGMGNPWWSPSPYYALCLGVPFINPVLHWDPKDPWNKAKWETQHPTLQAFDTPYVYHVHAHDYDYFVDAIHTASVTEIPSFIPEYMTEESVRERVRLLMETDWKEEAAILLEERLKTKQKGGSPYTFEL